jgi:hypothetical protein
MGQHRATIDFGHRKESLMRLRSYGIVTALALSLSISGVALTFAQDSGHGSSSQKQLDIAAARADRKALVGQNMYLTADQAKVFWPLYEEYENAMDHIEDRHIREIKAYVKAYRNLTNEDATKKLDEVMSIAQARLDVQKEYVPKFRAAMSSIMVTRFFQIDSKLRAMVQCDVAKMVPLAQPAQAGPTESSQTF